MTENKLHASSWLRASLMLLVVAASLSTALSESPSVSPARAIARLKAGNARFVSGKLKAKHLLRERKELVKGQTPYAIVLSCSDSRVAPEIVFDETLGKLFVVRVAGNVVDPVALGSIEYAAEHLHVKLLLVMGHESCGAVKAAIAGGETPPNIERLIERIMPAVKIARQRGLDEAGTLRVAIEENVKLQMENAVKESEVLHELVEKKQFRIAGGVYSLQSGRVKFVSAGE